MFNTLVLNSFLLRLFLHQWVMFGQKSAPSESGGGCHVGLSSDT